jgi:hypothetical protein
VAGSPSAGNDGERSHVRIVSLVERRSAASPQRTC